MNETVTGSQALACGSLAAGISLATGYPGSPATYVIDSLIEATSPDEVQVAWTSNEKTALEMAFGCSLSGRRSLVCVKSVGLNIALDPLMTINLSGCNAGFVILLGDDPGSWGSQNEQDSRILGMAAELPVLEPCTVPDAFQAMQVAFELSEEFSLPVIVRITRALSLANGQIDRTPFQNVPQMAFIREFNRWVVLPINVVPYHLRLIRKLEDVQERFETSRLNKVEGAGQYGLIASGFAYQKILDDLGGMIPPNLKILRLGTFHPLPTRLIADFMRGVHEILVIEENSPLVEKALRAVCQRLVEAGGDVDTPKIYGRESGHVPLAGELFGPHIAMSLNRFLPDLDLLPSGRIARPRPSLKPLGETCFYTRVFSALERAVEKSGGRENTVIVGDPGCMVRAQSVGRPLMDVKHSLGSSIGVATGIAVGQSHRDAGKHVVAIIGDSSLLHTGLNALMDAKNAEIRLLVLVLDNGTTGLSGGQPHPGSEIDARGKSRQGMDLSALASAAGANLIRRIDLEGGEDISEAIEAGLNHNGVAVVIAHGKCPDC